MLLEDIPVVNALEPRDSHICLQLIKCFAVTVTFPLDPNGVYGDCCWCRPPERGVHVRAQDINLVVADDEASNLGHKCLVCTAD